MWGNTQAHLGQSSILSSLTSTAEDQAETEALSYATALYEEYETEIWLTGFAIVAWMFWVSTRNTCKA